LVFTISGNVEKFVTIKPKRVFLRGFAGTQIKQTVRIQPAKKYPFRIIKAKATHGEFISTILEEDENTKVKIYLLTIENLKMEKGRYADMIQLETDSKIQPKIKISVYGNILPKEKEKVSDPSQEAGAREGSKP